MLAAVRIRGIPDTGKKAQDTLQQLRLHNKHNCMLYPDTESRRGMLQQVKDYVAYGEVDAETAEQVLTKRGQVDGTALPDAISELGYDAVSDLVDALDDGDLSLATMQKKGLQLPFRLRPPSKGFSDTRRGSGQGGALGERDDMDTLLKRMI